VLAKFGSNVGGEKLQEAQEDLYSGLQKTQKNKARPNVFKTKNLLPHLRVFFLFLFLRSKKFFVSELVK